MATCDCIGLQYTWVLPLLPDHCYYFTWGAAHFWTSFFAWQNEGKWKVLAKCLENILENEQFWQKFHGKMKSCPCLKCSKSRKQQNVAEVQSRLRGRKSPLPDINNQNNGGLKFLWIGLLECYGNWSVHRLILICTKSLFSMSPLFY